MLKPLAEHVNLPDWIMKMFVIMNWEITLQAMKWCNKNYRLRCLYFGFGGFKLRGSNASHGRTQIRASREAIVVLVEVIIR